MSQVNSCHIPPFVRFSCSCSPLSVTPLTRPISLRMPLTPPIRSLATLSPYPHGSASPPRSSAPRFVRRLFTPHSVSSAPWPEPRRETTMMRGAVPAAGPFARHSLTSSLTRPHLTPYTRVVILPPLVTLVR